MCLRIYAVTRRNKFLGGGLLVLTVVQFCFGIYSTAVDAKSPREFINRLFVRILSHRWPVQPLPKINLDAYRICLPQRSRSGELVFTSFSITFGTPSPSDFQHNSTMGVLMYFIPRTPLRCGIRSFYIHNYFRHSQRINHE